MTLILITIRAATIAKPLQRLPLFTTFQRERYTWKRSPGHPTLCLTPLPVHLHEGPPPYWVISLPVQFSAVPSPAAKPPCKSDLPDGSTTLLPHPPAGPRRCYGMMHRCIPANLPPPPSPLRSFLYLLGDSRALLLIHTILLITAYDLPHCWPLSSLPVLQPASSYLS